MATPEHAKPLAFPNKKRKRSRWNQDTTEQKTVIPGMPTVLPQGLTREQERAYIVQLQIEDLTRRLLAGDLGSPINPQDRSPSPEPIYNGSGKRLNTREQRTRKKLEEERHHLITEMTAFNPDFKPPADYKPPAARMSDKVMIPQAQYPEINFMGLLIGPRGNTLKNIEKACNAKIMIRGKGSVKEGKAGRKNGQMLQGEGEPLHALITASTRENVQKAVEKIQNILKQGIEIPEDKNDLRKMQLQELARLNGTLREDDHKILRPWKSLEKTSITNATICTKCGGAGHVVSDCKLPKSQDQQSALDKDQLDKEYLSLMAELGEAPPDSASGGSTSEAAVESLAKEPPPAAASPDDSSVPPLMSATPWMNSIASTGWENHPHYEMPGRGPGGLEDGPYNFPQPPPNLSGRRGRHDMQYYPNMSPPPWMQPPPGHHGPPPVNHLYLRNMPVEFQGLSPTSSNMYEATFAESQWAAPTLTPWPSSPNAEATSVAASISPCQQQYGFQYPLSMTAKTPPGGSWCHERGDFPGPLVTLPESHPQQYWWMGQFNKSS